MTVLRVRVAVLVALLLATSSGYANQAVTADELGALIDKLGAFDFAARTDAARRLRRASTPMTLAALEQAARTHKDSYVRFRALVLLTGQDETAADRVMRDLVRDPNDRVRMAAYQWLERHRNLDVLPTLIGALTTEQSEFVRPALTRAFAAYAEDARARSAILPLVSKGEDMFRGAVIEALGDYRGTFALPAIIEVAKREGPLQDDAVTAIGKIGSRSAGAALVELQKVAPPPVQPTIAAAFCLLDFRCEQQTAYLRRTFAYAVANDDPPLLRGTVHALGVLASPDRPWALADLLDAGATANERVRAPVALGLGALAIRHPRLVLDDIERRGVQDRDLELVRDAFDMLAEEFEEEQFYGELRRQYWAAPPGSPRHLTAERLMAVLEF